MTERLVESISPQSQFPPEDFMFHKIMAPEQLRKIFNFTSNIIIYIMGRSGRDFFRQIRTKKAKEISVFFANYHRIIIGLNQTIPSKINQNISQYPVPLCNDLSLHFILLISYSHLRNKNHDQARRILKKGWNYANSKDVAANSILLASVLSNLSMLYKQVQKHYKGLVAALKAIQIMEKWIKRIKQDDILGISKQKKSNKVIEDAVILINAYLIAKSHLQGILKNRNKSYYRNMLEVINYTGFRYALKYLGSQSYFTKKFQQKKIKGQIYLPVFKNPKHQQPDPYNLLKTQIQEGFNMIAQILKTKKQPLIVLKERQQTEQQPQQQVKQEQKETYKNPFDLLPLDIIAKAFMQQVQINGWEINVQLLSRSRDLQLYGDVQLNCKKDGKRVHLVVNQAKLGEILKQINFEDAKPYECDIHNLTKKQFVTMCIVPFLSVQQEGDIQIYPKSPGILGPLEFNFLGIDCLIFINHIRFRDFRVSISPKLQAYSVYLNIELLSQTINTFLDIKTRIDQNIQKAWQLLASKSRRKKLYPKMRNPSQTTCTVINQPLFKNIFLGIIGKFQSFMRARQDQTSIAQLLQGSSNFYKFLQIQNEENQQLIGRFYYIRYLKNLNSYDIYLQNSYRTYSLEGQNLAKGNAFYSFHNFYRDFGIPVNMLTIDQSMAFCQILCKKYSLRTFDKILSSKDQDIYVENAIAQFPITSKSYRRKFIQNEDFFCPITASIVSVNNQFPVGIKVIGYDPISCLEAGYFFHAVGDQWRKPTKMQAQAVFNGGETTVRVNSGAAKAQHQMQSTDYKSNLTSQLAYNQVTITSRRSTTSSQSKIQNTLFKPYMEQYVLNNAYFLPEWMQKIGFEKLLQKVVVSHSSFKIKNFQGIFNRVNQILQQMLQ